MDINQFLKEKREEIMALAARHRAENVRLVKPDQAELSAEQGIKLVASFPQDSHRSSYFDVLVEFQEDLEAWLGIKVHVYDANAFKGDDGTAFLNDTLAI